MNKKIKDQINQVSLDLRLAAFRNDIEEIITRSVQQNASYEQVILDLLKAEQQVRLINRKKVQMRNAAFPQLKYLQDINKADLPVDAISKLPTLETLDFITTGQNVILGGSPGTGKTHIAIGLGIKACQQGYNVMFTTVSKLLTQIRENYSNRTLRALELKFEKYDLVICDEFGYISFDKQGAEMLFNHLSLRTGIKSTIITSNLSFDKWNDIFGKDTVLTAALLDRLTHKAYLVNMNGQSYRMKETKKIQDSLKIKAA
ncbi:MAG: IS21-like element helper ATPase IstB [Sediminibacterium sp.]|nr:IS21-like element helper ATPase IstB [Sediminibacterium sp.]